MAENKKWKILVAETVGEAGLQILRDAPDIELIEKVGMSRENLLKIVKEYPNLKSVDQAESKLN